MPRNIDMSKFDERSIKIFKRVKELGVTTSLDMSLPNASSESGKVNWGKILKELLPYVDIYIPSVEETIRIAYAVGGQNVQTYDALSGIKTWDETLAMIPGWKKNKAEISGDYWKYDEEKAVWIGKQHK